MLENSNNYYKLELARSLLHFTEFDFTYFWEQCIAAGKIAYKTGTLPSDKLTIARTAVAKCHPYVEATLSTGFDSITIDCIIAYICSSEHIGLEELWSRCISPKNNYEQAIFRRISEYKTGRSINRWVNIVRMNEYARAKLDFIYDDPDGEPVTQEEAAYRREYFDLAFSVAANETGYSGTEMPYVRRYNPALLPGAAFQMGKISKSIYNRVSDALSSAKASAQRSDTVSDQNAMDVFSYIKNLSRPEQMDMKFVREAFGSLPDTTIYMPSGLKSLIDLEFDLIAEEGIMLVKCRNCGKYFIKDDGYDRPYCDRVGPTGKTCRETDTEFLRMKAEAAAAKAAAEAAEREAAAKAAAEAAEREAAAKAAAEAAAKEAEEKAAAERAAAEAAAAEAAYDEDIEEEYKAPPAPRYQQKRGTSIPAETEKRSQRIYNALYRRVGRIMDENEFREWSQYLSNLKRNVKNGECALTELDDFLDYSEGLYAEKKNAARARVTGNAPQPRRRASDDTPVGRKLPAVQTVEAKRFSPAVFERISRTPEKRGLSEDELFLAASEAGYSPAAGYPAGNDEDIHVKYIHSTEEFTEAPVRTMRGYTGYTAPAKPVYDEQPPAPEYPTYDNDVIPDRGAPAYSGKPYEADDTADNAPPEKEYKPFMPKKYASVYDAMMDASASGNDSNDDGYYGSYTPGGGIRKPDWDYLKK